jgi:hypothetical protein
VQHVSDAAVETIKIAPPAAATLWTFAGLSLDEAIAYLTLLYLLALLAEKVAKWVWTWKRRRR